MNAEQPGKPYSILYLDDSSTEHLSLHHAAWSIRAPIRIWSVTTPEAAVESLSLSQAHQHSWPPIPVLILLELHIQSTTSVDLLCWIRSRLHLKKIPVVMYSSSDEADDVARCYAAGANAFLRKPIGLGRLQEVVDALTRCIRWRAIDPLVLLDEYRPDPHNLRNGAGVELANARKPSLSDAGATG